jgi:hypothetical protein
LHTDVPITLQEEQRQGTLPNAMIGRALVTFLAIFAMQPAMGKESARAQVIGVVREFELSVDRTLLLPDATLEALDRPRSHPDRKRLWRDVPGSGVVFEHQVRRIVIVRLSANKATVDARVASVVIDDPSDGASSRSDPITISDRVELRRTGDQWRIGSVARYIQR